MVSKKKKYYQVFDNRGKEWIPEEEQLLLQRFNSGIKIAVLAELHGRSVGAIRSGLRKLQGLK